MAYLNKLQVIGNLTADPQSRQAQGEDGPVAVCNLRVAVNSPSSRGKAPVFITVVTWRKNAEWCAEHLKKGDTIYAEGEIRRNEWEGEKGRQLDIELIANGPVQYLSSPRGTSNKTTDVSNDASNEGNNPF